MFHTEVVQLFYADEEGEVEDIVMDDVECSSQATAICEKRSYLQDQNGNVISLM